MNQLKIGDEITVAGDSGFCDSGKAKITKVKTKHDEDSGNTYTIYYAADQWFDGRTGWAITSPLAYYIQEVLDGRVKG
jgi:hypothetical protein